MFDAGGYKQWHDLEGVDGSEQLAVCYQHFYNMFHNMQRKEARGGSAGPSGHSAPVSELGSQIFDQPVPKFGSTIPPVKHQHHYPQYSIHLGGPPGSSLPQAYPRLSVFSMFISFFTCNAKP